MGKIGFLYVALALLLPIGVAHAADRTVESDARHARVVARELAAAGDPEVAAEVLLYAAHNDPQDLSIRAELGSIFLAIGRIDDGIRQLQFIVTRRPDDIEANLLLARALTAVGRLQDAKRELIAAVGRTGNAGLMVELSLVSSKLGHFGEALQHLRDARAAAPKSAEIHNNLGTAFEQLGEYELAYLSYKEANELKPSDSVISANLDRMARGREEWKRYLNHVGKTP